MLAHGSKKADRPDRPHNQPKVASDCALGIAARTAQINLEARFWRIPRQF